MRENAEAQSCHKGQRGHMTLCKYVNIEIFKINTVKKNEKDKKNNETIVQQRVNHSQESRLKNNVQHFISYKIETSKCFNSQHYNKILYQQCIYQQYNK